MASLPDPKTVAPAEALRLAGILSALADDLDARTPERPTSLVGIPYRHLVARKARKAVIAAIRFRAAAYRRRFINYIGD